ncbi:hypothetical protein D7X74_24430 [Corallococcus sp. CA047B]|uniref:hypothetical protein n=1 Tax=Corallococcus sp. CA047B TaxID=2316729 RepID=UPI000EA1D5F3|nr:hypothetical protein [Corallococcus sp. CA047B]RKH11973.1 hypothetical protein D7X74_24430 [Corallococcus sp. CA047B]
MSTPTKRLTSAVRVRLGNDAGTRVTLADGTGPVVSVWNESTHDAWLRAMEMGSLARASLANCKAGVTRRPTR